MKLPLVTYYEPIYHAGEMQGKPWPTSSMEGPLLSCSPCPQDWQKIARLGDVPHWEIIPRKKLQVVNFRKLKGQEKLEWITAAQRAGLIQPGYTFRYSVYHEDEVNYGYASTRAQAEKETEEKETIRKQKTWIATAKLRKYWYGSCKGEISPFFVLDAAFSKLVQDHKLKVSGILWDDRYEPHNLSAPRLGIFPIRIATVDRRHKHILLK